jgi:hypothetical protein
VVVVVELQSVVDKDCVFVLFWVKEREREQAEGGVVVVNRDLLLPERERLRG